jgi:hypothetical protein
MSPGHGASRQAVKGLLLEHIPALADDRMPIVVVLDGVDSVVVARRPRHRDARLRRHGNREHPVWGADRHRPSERRRRLQTQNKAARVGDVTSIGGYAQYRPVREEQARPRFPNDSIDGDRYARDSQLLETIKATDWRISGHH